MATITAIKNGPYYNGWNEYFRLFDLHDNIFPNELKEDLFTDLNNRVNTIIVIDKKQQDLVDNYIKRIKSPDFECDGIINIDSDHILGEIKILYFNFSALDRLINFVDGLCEICGIKVFTTLLK